MNRALFSLGPYIMDLNTNMVEMLDVLPLIHHLMGAVYAI
jgi:hypothetical protein